MTLRASAADDAFRAAFEAGTFPPGDFNHRAHVRLAYVYLCGSDVERAYAAMRAALLAFLACHGVDPAKYHDTMTRAWVMAVRHFMERTPSAESADAFIDANPRLLDPKIMLTHYSAGLLFSDAARASFAAPDIDPIPTYEKGE